jgi:chromosome segregation ATPase
MMAPLPPPNSSGTRPDLPRVRLEVRTGGGRAVAPEFGGDEFIIGGAAGCDLRLPAAGAPPIAVQLTRRSDGVRGRRVAAGLPVQLNGASLPAGTTTPVHDGDVLTLAGLTIAVRTSAVPAVEPAPPPYLSPRFVPLDDPPPALPAPDAPPEPAGAAGPSAATDLSLEHRALADLKRALEAGEAERRAAWATQDADLVRRDRELARQAAELEADRQAWYDRRGAIEQELADRRAKETSAQEAELAAARADLVALRRQWGEECNRHRADLIRQVEKLKSDRDALEAERAALEPVRAAARDEQARAAALTQELARQRELFAADRDIFDKARATFDAHRAAETDRLTTWDADLTARAAAVADREGLVRTARDEFEAERARFRDELGRFERRAAALDEAERDLAERAREVTVRLEQLKRDAGELEETVRLAGAQQDRLRAETERLDRQKADLDARSAALAERAGQIEAQQAVVAVFRSKLDRSRQDMEREAWQLAAARAREDESQAELRKRIQEAEELRASLSAVQADTAQERRRLDERDSLLAAALEEIRLQKAALAAEAERLAAREAALDARSADFAEQAGTLKGRMAQAIDLQTRLEADRVAVREREAALAQAEDAQLGLQEQLRRRAEDLNNRGRALDEMARQLAADRAALSAARGAVETTRQTAADDLAAQRQELAARTAALGRRAGEYAEKEQALARQSDRLKEVGAAVAAERKSLADARAACEAERARLDRFRAQVGADFDALRAQAPELDDQARLALERLGAARDMLRGHLSELNEFARTSRADLEAARAQVRQDAERLRERHDALDRARDEHRLAVAAFRQQLIEWQGTVGDIRRQLATSENRLDAKAAAATEAASAAADATRHLAEETDRLRREREDLAARRVEMERHLSDMREWYRKKLRELAHTNGRELKLHEPNDPAAPGGRGPIDPTHPLFAGRPAPADEPEPGDRQLGELLKSLALVDPETLTALWAEAARQRRTLRQVLLASGAITLYQLALIEAGNLDALVLGRFRVIDRLRASAREAVYRVFDPKRADRAAAPPTGADRAGVYLLRHLGEAEAADAVRPDEFRQRFAAVRDAAHPNLAGVVEVLDINGRPAALQEWLTGLASADWPAFAAHPGCWVRLATMAAGALDAAHRAGLVHGRLTSDAFLLTPDGALKVTGFGEPPWLAPGGPVAAEVSAAADLRAFGQVLFGWSQLAGKKRVAKSKAFPEALWGVVRRLEADAEPPMADTVAAAQPYQAAGELLADLQRIARETPFSDDAWEKLLKHVADNAPDSPGGLKKAG